MQGYTLEQWNASLPPVPTVRDEALARLWGGEIGTTLEFGTSKQRVYAPRDSVPALARISGANATATVLAWVRVNATARAGGVFIGGVWNEASAWRQYALFMNKIGHCSTTWGVVAHISGEGGPSPGRQFCMSRACGATPLDDGYWHCIANTYNGVAIRAYVNGSLDARTVDTDMDNPFQYPDPGAGFPTGGIYSPPQGMGADFAIGRNLIHEGGGIGPAKISNMFEGRVALFAVYDKALSAEQVRAACGFA